MTMFLVAFYISFYVFTRFRFAYAAANSEGEEFAYKFAIIPFLLEAVAVSLLVLNLFDAIHGKKINGEEDDL